ncbi:hypothetical protein [Campylobacter ureolyticus]|uniref:hypothetical protein n=1 Tax=Campylobacter ureolyticus TaxID=827 RepID=UPI0022B50BE1|nr:hypothetical protein [Campylobacter ureolyticus]MCZ6171993.1 hypothetical protein [Campylobacter ureolyticus]
MKILLKVAILFWLLLTQNFAKNPVELNFEGLYSSWGALGLEMSDKVLNSVGKEVKIIGFMAPPLKADAQFFVLTQQPMALCPFCSSDADWPPDIIVVFLKKRQSFVQFNAPIEVIGRLEVGSQTDEETGFVSLIRIVNAKFKKK